MDWAVVTCPGSREVNEDSIGHITSGDHHCFVVADGLGGHGMGEVASSVAIAAFQQVFSEEEPSPGRKMELAFSLAQQNILREQEKAHNRFGIKTTVVALVLARGAVFWAHIGDSRLYAFSHGRVRGRTLDHSVPQMLVRSGDIKEKQIRFHPDRNKLLRVLGVSGDSPAYEVSEQFPGGKWDSFLLCTDGFWEYITEREMGRCRRAASSAQDWLDRMTEIVRRRGAGQQMDNYSAIAVVL